MIKDMVNPQELKVNVILRDGTEYLDKDTTPQPFGENEKVVAFWDGGKVVVIPFDLVARVEMFV